MIKVSFRSILGLQNFHIWNFELKAYVELSIIKMIYLLLDMLITCKNLDYWLLDVLLNMIATVNF